MTKRSFPTVAESVADWIGEEVMSGRWQPGRRITEAEVAEAVGVSRQPVREALRLLSEKGIVTIVPRIGALVSEFSVDKIEQIYRTREHLETWLVAQGVVAATDEERVAFLDDATRDSEAGEEADRNEIFDRAWALRRRLMTFSGNHVAVSMVEDLRSMLRGYPQIVRRHESQLQASRDCVRGLVAALITRDPDAAAEVVRALHRNSLPLVRAAYAQATGASTQG